MNWGRKFLWSIWSFIMSGKLSIPGTILKADDILSAYVVIDNGRKVCIVICAKFGAETYPYTPELDDKLLEVLSIEKLEEKELSIDYLIEFYAKNEGLISAISPFIGKNNSLKNG